jgi:hypothetical protein
MADESNQAQPTKTTTSVSSEEKRGLSLSEIYGLLPDWLRSHLTPTFGAVLALLGFWFSPLKDMGFHMIWHESPTIELRPNSDKVHEGDEFMIAVVVTPHKIDLSPGTLFVDYSTDTLQLRGPGNVISTPGEKESAVAATLTFDAIKHGPAMAHISLRTKYGIYESQRQFIVSDHDSGARPSKFNFSGKWNLRVAESFGELHLVDKDGAISGSYELESGDIGTIRGVRGPAAFQVLLSSTKKHLTYTVECLVKLQDDFLELTGNAKAQTQQISFYASSKS